MVRVELRTTGRHINKIIHAEAGLDRMLFSIAGHRRTGGYKLLLEAMRLDPGALQDIDEEGETMVTTTAEVLDAALTEDSRPEGATSQVMAGVDPSAWDDSGDGGGGYCGLGSPRTVEAAAPAAAGLPAEEPPAQGSGGGGGCGLSGLDLPWTAVAAAATVAEPLTMAPDFDSGQGDAEDDQLRIAEGGPPGDGDPSDNEDDTTDSDEETAQDPSLRANEIKRELLTDITLVPIVYRPPRIQRTEHLHPRICRRRKYAVTQRQWLKDRWAVVRDILDGKDLLAVTAPPEGTRDFWLNLFGCPSPPIPEEIPCGEINIMGPVTSAEVEWLKKTLDRNSAPGPDGLKATDFISIPNDRICQAYTELSELGVLSGDWQDG